MQAKAVLELEMVLADEKTALLEGDYAALPGLAAVKAELIAELTDGLTGGPVSPDLLRQIKRRIDANQTLLQAAIDGVKAAKDRLSALAEVRDSLRVYDQSGAEAVAQMPRSTLEKKA